MSFSEYESSSKIASAPLLYQVPPIVLNSAFCCQHMPVIHLTLPVISEITLISHLYLALGANGKEILEQHLTLLLPGLASMPTARRLQYAKRLREPVDSHFRLWRPRFSTTSV